MTSFLRKLINLNNSRYIFKRRLHLKSTLQSYEEEGKTTITILNKNSDYGLMVDSVSSNGFVLNNNISTIGPIVIFPKTVLSWNIESSEHMNEESLLFFLHLDPKLDIFIIGLDDKYPINTPFLKNIKELYNKHKIPIEILPVQQACATFNFLNSDGRYVAAALIPPKVKEYKHKFLHENYKHKLSIARQMEREADPYFSERDLNKQELIKDKEFDIKDKLRSPFGSNKKQTEFPTVSDNDRKKLK